MRILHVLAERGYSGGEHQLRAVLEALARGGHESLAILNPGARFAQTCGELGVRVHELRMRNDADVFAASKLRRLYKHFDADLIHFACSRSHKIGAHASIRMRGLAPRIATRRMDYALGRSRYRRWLYGSAVQGVVAVSSGVAREVLATGADPGRVHVIHDGVDYPRLSGLRASELRAEQREELGVESACIVGLTTASLHRRKGHDVLLRALARLSSAVPSANSKLVWLFAGDGPEREALEAQAERDGLLYRPQPGGGREDAASHGDHVSVRFLGRCAVEPLLAAADVFALPSRKEGLGVALLEAMACGLPVVASSVGGILDAVSEGSGVLFDVEDDLALSSEIATLCSDADLRMRLGEAARARVADKFTIEGMCRDTIALYAQVIEEAGRS